MRPEPKRESPAFMRGEEVNESKCAYCSWDCLLKAAGQVEPPIEIPWDQALGGSDD
jgi:hypothetical protein